MALQKEITEQRDKRYESNLPQKRVGLPSHKSKFHHDRPDWALLLFQHQQQHH